MTRSTRSDNDDACGKVRTKTKINVDNFILGGGRLYVLISLIGGFSK